MGRSCGAEKRAWITVVILTICYVVSILDRLIVSLLVEPIKTDLSLSDLQISLILGPAFAVLYALLSVPLGRLADLTNRRNLVAASIGAWSLFTVGCGLAWNFSVFLAARIGVGIGEAGLTPAAYSMVSDLFKPNRLGRAFAVYIMGGVVGGGVAFLTGGMIYGAFDKAGPLTLPLIGTLVAWKMTLVTLGASGLILALLTRLWLREPARNTGEGRPSIKVVWAHIRALRRVYGWVFTAYAALCIAVYGYTNWLPAFLMREFDLPVAKAGQYIGLIVLIAGVAGPLSAGWLADKWQKRHSAMAAMRLMAVLGTALAISTFLTFAGAPLEWVLTGCVCVSYLATGMMVLVPITIQMLSASRMRGQMSGITLMIGNVVGQSLGPMGIAFFSENVFPQQGLGAGMASVLSISAMVCVFASLRARRAWISNEAF